MATIKLEEMPKEELIRLVVQLKSRKKYGLVWEEKPEDVVSQCKSDLPVLEEISNRAIVMDSEKETNILIEGDNYHSLSVLNYTHTGKIDVIYIDPPYNTGSKDWKYNNHFVDKNDTYRHSKWLCMMYHRLENTKTLLKTDGVLICAIDENEVNRLGLLLEELFPERELITIVIEHNPKGSPTRNFTYTHEYALFMIPRGMSIIGKDPAEKVDTRNLRRAGRASSRIERPTMFYPIYVHNGKITRIGSPPLESFHPHKRNVFEKNGEIAVWPIDDDGKERRWHFGLDSINEYIERIIIKEINPNDIQLYVTAAEGRYKTVWKGGKYDAGKYGTSLVREIVGLEFPYPKSIFNTMKCLETIVLNRPNAIILDFFAGSGTTGHAVLLLNKEDGGKRQFILCTNNENNIAEDICYPRLKNVLNGVEELSDITGITANLRYYKTAFVSKSKVSDDTRHELVKHSTEMLILKENTFEKVLDKRDYKIFRNNNRSTGILFNLDALEVFKSKLMELHLPVSIYVFSITNDSFDEDFQDLQIQHEICPIPESILEVYRKLFKENL